MDQNGKLLQDGRICWSEVPASVVIHKPYAIARLPKHIEVLTFSEDAFCKKLLLTVSSINFVLILKFLHYYSTYNLTLMQIRSLRTTYPLVQTIVLRDVRLLVKSTDCIIAALGNSMYGLLPVPFGAQVPFYNAYALFIQQ